MPLKEGSDEIAEPLAPEAREMPAVDGPDRQLEQTLHLRT